MKEIPPSDNVRFEPFPVDILSRISTTKEHVWQEYRINGLDPSVCHSIRSGGRCVGAQVWSDSNVMGAGAVLWT